MSGRVVERRSALDMMRCLHVIGGADCRLPCALLFLLSLTKRVCRICIREAGWLQLWADAKRNSGCSGYGIKDTTSQNKIPYLHTHFVVYFVHLELLLFFCRLSGDLETACVVPGAQLGFTSCWPKRKNRCYRMHVHVLLAGPTGC